MTARPVPVRPAPGDGFELASIVVVTCDGLVFTRLCLESVLADTDHPSFELVVVDNGSTDGTPAYLRELARTHRHVRVIANASNRGFPAACNQGLAAARGQLLVLLNNDTIVAPGWLSRLACHLERDRDALVGPVTNRIGNEAQVAVPYRTYGGFRAHAAERAAAHDGESFEIGTLTMFCLAMSAEVHERLGSLDEGFGVGTLEDDDYSMRARRAGLRLRCAEDVLVHHFGEGSFGRLVPGGERDRILEENRRRFEEKWRVPWQPYERRPDAVYDRTVERARALIRGCVPAGGTVAVVSRGDDRLVELGGGLRGRHFPQADGGVWAGHHPADGEEAVQALEAARASGARYLAVPRTSFWWLDFYGALARRLDGATRLAADEHCIVFELEAAVSAAAARGSDDGG